jgi:DNA-binding transcriptional regulator YiaG
MLYLIFSIIHTIFNNLYKLKSIFKSIFRIILPMEIADLFNILHNAVESENFGRKISLKDMANELGIPMRTYQDWKLGRSNPQAAKAVMKMLGKLEDDEIVRVVRKINKLSKENG